MAVSTSVEFGLVLIQCLSWPSATRWDATWRPLLLSLLNLHCFASTLTDLVYLIVLEGKAISLLEGAHLMAGAVSSLS